MKLTPLKLTLLMHIYAIAEPFNHPNGPAWESGLQELLKEELIKTFNTPCDYMLTTKGHVFVKLILQTPVPESVTKWFDPRTGEEIKFQGISNETLPTYQRVAG